MTIESLQSLSVLLLRAAGFIWLIRGAFASIRENPGSVTSSAAMAIAFFLAAMAQGGNS